MPLLDGLVYSTGTIDAGSVGAARAWIAAVSGREAIEAVEEHRGIERLVQDAGHFHVGQRLEGVLELVAIGRDHDGWHLDAPLAQRGVDLNAVYERHVQVQYQRVDLGTRVEAVE